MKDNSETDPEMVRATYKKQRGAREGADESLGVAASAAVKPQRPAETDITQGGIAEGHTTEPATVPERRRVLPGGFVGREGSAGILELLGFTDEE